MPVWLTGSLIAKGLIILAIISAVGTGVYKVKQWGANEVRAEWEQAERDQRERELNQAGRAVTGLEKDRGVSRKKYAELEQRLADITNRPVYSTVCIDTDGMRDINAALVGSN